MVKQGKEALFDLLDGRTLWPPVVVPFGLDPFGWHGEKESYRDICTYAINHCTLLPKVFPFANSLCLDKGKIGIITDTTIEKDGNLIRKSEIIKDGDPILTMEEIKTAEDSSWKIRKRWLENEKDIDLFISLKNITPCNPKAEVIEKKAEQLGNHGLPYAEVMDPFGAVCEMFNTDSFYIKLITDNEQISYLLKTTEERIIKSIESLCEKAKSPFILRLIGAEFAVPPFLNRSDFLKYEEYFYKTVAEITDEYNIPSAFHCHGPVKDIMDDVWNWGYSIMEPFEPPPRGNVTIKEALQSASGRGIVLGGLDDVTIINGTREEVKNHVEDCLSQARGANGPFILSQTATPFYNPISDTAKENILLFLELGNAG
ncbi:MAG: hypothetical protein J7K04_05315 [Spirochaetales bacterium]|nr:hypothetical protein [Spirochaetales bacterium]